MKINKRKGLCEGKPRWLANAIRLASTLMTPPKRGKGKQRKERSYDKKTPLVLIDTYWYLSIIIDYYQYTSVLGNRRRTI